MITKPLFAKKKCSFNAFIKSVSVHNIALKIQKNESGFPLTRGRNGFLNFFFLFGEDSSKPVSNRSTGLLHVSSDLGKQGRQSLCGKDPEFGSSVSGTARCNLSDFKQNPAKTKIAVSLLVFTCTSISIFIPIHLNNHELYCSI